MWDETGEDMQVIWVRGEQEYFFETAWTTQIRLNSFKKLGPAAYQN
jgi:hypothetical protein